MKVYAATGHRPNKLGGYSTKLSDIRTEIARKYLGDTRPDVCISGMALGWDTDFALAAISLNIPLVAAIPFKGQECRWMDISKEIYFHILDKATNIVYVCDPGYATWKMQKRNQYMVDHCTSLISLWDGSKGGTDNCIDYAKKKGRVVVNLWGTYLPYLESFTAQQKGETT